MEYNKEINEVLKEVNSTKNGLTNEEVEKRYEKYGKNILPQKKKDSIIKIFFKELSAPLELILVIAYVRAHTA